ncbi:MAG: hypothetical protein K0Q95_1717 [Bacteroidota bacterium]|jgi:hypothetical protein|nr:hypothetical protein [Bacteroidota bacterium]
MPHISLLSDRKFKKNVWRIIPKYIWNNSGQVKIQYIRNEKNFTDFHFN